jgi:diguanylate cyclase (GGDEF)-like protein
VVVVCTDITAEVDLASTRERQATTDPLTGLLNRRGVEPQLTRAMHLATRHGTSLSVALFDIDHFKRVNDRYGHNVGDQLLRAVAGAIARTIRGGDLVARWGGEEFLVVLPHTDLEPAHCAADRIRRAVEALRVAEIGPVTISGGVATFSAGEPLSETVGRADKLLYEAKAGGRNQIR